MMYIPESPKANTLNELTEEEAFKIIFPYDIGQNEDLFENNLDYLYCINSQKSTDISSKKEDKNSPKKNENYEKNLILDDYEMFYNKFADIDEDSIFGVEKNDSQPCFILDKDYEKEKLFSSIEDEKIIKIEKSIEKSIEKILEKEKNICNEASKEKIFKIEKIPKIKKFKNLKHLKNKKKIFSKHKHFKNLKNRNANIYDKNFPFTMGSRLIYNSKSDNESSSYNIEIPISSHSISKNNSDLDKSNFSPHKKNTKNNNKKENVRNRKYKKKKKDCIDEKSIDEIYNDIEKINNLTKNFFNKFKIKKYFIDENGKRKKIKKKRKFKSDDIRKKIKSRFHKTFKNIINVNLKRAGSKELFDYFPQCFVGNISKKFNSKCLELTFKELISTNFVIELDKKDYPNSEIDMSKYKKNLRVLKYLENNPEISKKSGFDLIKDRKYKDILNIYFSSLEFENSLIQLTNENESDEYIQEYLSCARSFISFYSDKNIDDNNQKKEEVNDQDEIFG